MTDPRVAGELLASARAKSASPGSSPATSPSAPPAPRAAHAPARRAPPPSPATPERARPAPGLGLPLSDLHLRRIEQLEEVAGPGRYQGWGREGDVGAFCVDVAEERYRGETLHEALGAALRDLGGRAS